MLSRLQVRNFKSIGGSGVEIRPKPLTLLMGPNGSGKSSILEALCILSQSSGQSGLNYSGPLVRYESPEAFIHRGEGSRILSFKVGFTPSPEEVAPMRFVGASRNIVEVATSYSIRTTPLEVVQSVFLEDLEIARIVFDGNQSIVRIPEQYTGVRAMSDARTVFNPSAFLARGVEHDSLIVGREITQFVSAKMRKIFFISAVRGDARTFLDATTGQDSDWVGTGGEYTPHILAKLFALRENEERSQLVIKWAERLGLASLKAGWYGGNRLRSDYSDTVLETYLRTSLASYGARQMLTILTQLFASSSGDILIIEEPEISLHPESQMLLPELFAEAIRRGVQIIITTHSIFLPLSLWRPISANTLTKDQIAVYHAVKESEGTTVEEIPVSKDGSLEKWIPSFSKAEEKAIKDFLKIAPSGPTP